MAMADKRRLTAAGQRGTGARSDEPLPAMDFLCADEFDEDVHVPALYRTAPSALDAAACAAMRERGEQVHTDPVAAALGFPSPALVVDRNDRQGIWQANPQLAKALGEDPRKQSRRSEQDDASRPFTAAAAVVPAGLKNLGATCYLNSLLQYLFFNVDFRQNLLGAPSESAVVGSLQRVFALLAKGERCAVDPTEFIKAAGLDAEEQEDVTEFRSFLLEWLERELGGVDAASTSGGGGAFVPALFQGELSQVIQCGKDPSHRSERHERFYEVRARLTLEHLETVSKVNGDKKPVAGQRKKRSAGGKGKCPTVRLEKLLLDTTFSDESFDGSNQYHCDKCDAKVDAKKTTRLSELPPYLHVTVERYHYDYSKGERHKLNNPVSFPRRLELWLNTPPLPCELEGTCALGGQQGGVGDVSPGLPLEYECIGYLEHVSDSALSGHYTATLLKEDMEAASTLNAARSCASMSPAEAFAPLAPHVEAGEPPVKRQRNHSVDAAAGAPRVGEWWTLDDSTVTPVTWGPPSLKAPDEAAESEAAQPPAVAACSLPERIESAHAYLILYRRRSFAHGQLSPIGVSKLPQPFASFVDTKNGVFAEEQRAFEARVSAVDAFLDTRRRACNGLVQALRQDTLQRLPDGGPSKQPAYSLVPAAWLTAFLHGKDQSIEELVSGAASKIAPVSYGGTLLRGKSGNAWDADPLALWCGELRLVPTAALDALGGLGGLDRSLFLPLEGAMSRETSEAAWRLFQMWCREQEQVALVLEGEISLSDARSLSVQGKGDQIVWVSPKLRQIWQRVTTSMLSVAAGPQRKVAQWRAFLSEVHDARFGAAAATADAGAGVGAAATSAPETKDSKVATESPMQGQAAILDGLLCPHGGLRRPRSPFLVQRRDLEVLLERAADKERAYAELWPESRHTAPRLSVGHPDSRLLGFDDICTECSCTSSRSSQAGTMEISPLQRCLVVRRRYPSGAVRKQGEVVLPEGVQATGLFLRALVHEQLKMPLAKVFVQNPEKTSSETELKNEEVLGDLVEVIIVEKDETVAPEREAVAFEGSIFRRASSLGA